MAVTMTGMAAPTAQEGGALAGRPAFRPLNRPALVVILGALVLCSVAFASLMYGAVTLSFGQAWSGLTSESDVFARNVVWQIRFPRVVDAMFVGASLAAAGALLQGVTRNPLADPTILGVTAAAGLASAAVIVVDPQVPQWGIAAACAGGGLVGAAILYFISS